MRKALVIYHRVDIDGWLSAAIIKRYMDNQPEYEVDYLGFNYGDDLDPSAIAKKYDEVITVDVSINIDDMIFLVDRVDFVYIDHHTMKINEVLRKVDLTNVRTYINTEELPIKKKAACEITWLVFFTDTPMPRLIKDASSYDCFRHKAYEPIEAHEVLMAQYGLRAIIHDVDSAYKLLNESFAGDTPVDIMEDIVEDGYKIFNYLKVEARAAYDKREVFSIGGKRFAAINKERFNPVNFGIHYHEDGYDGVASYWYAEGMWNFSLYNDNDSVDCAILAAQFGGGGHKGAAGFRLTNEYFNNFLITNQTNN